MLFADRGSLFISVDKFRQNLTWRIPMKIASILAGVAVAALTATSASAGEINQGQFTMQGFSGLLSGLNGTHDAPLTILGVGFDLGLNKANALNGASPVSSWHANGQSGANNGNAAGSDGATFTLNGNVSTDCAYYSGTGNHTLNFGTIGIYASDDTGPAAAFTMTDSAELKIQTNLAGCNTKNTVKISKVNMVNAVTTGFDALVFQNDLPFSVDAKYKAGPINTTVATNQTLPLAANATAPATRQHGAWKSPMTLDIKIAQQPKALLAGDYTGSVSVEIKADL